MLRRQSIAPLEAKGRHLVIARRVHVVKGGDVSAFAFRESGFETCVIEFAHFRFGELATVAVLDGVCDFVDIATESMSRTRWTNQSR